MKRLHCFETNLNRTHTVSPHCSRKSFLAKLGGMLAVIGIVPALRAKQSQPNVPPSASAPIPVRRDQRTVAREEGSY